MLKDSLQVLFEEYERQAIEEARETAAQRKEAHGILKTNSFERKISKGQGIVLAYGMTGELFSPADLKRFLEVMEKRQKRFNPDPGIHGVPYASLLRASRPIDKERAKAVKNATLYQRKDNTLFFQVTGNSKQYYRVQIRLEEWGAYLTGKTGQLHQLEAVKRIVKGRLSIECPCGRHQYWYRYLATLGQYALSPKESGFPKIRNPQLGGCCCKHVLKVLNELVSTRVLFILAKELERERNAKGFSGSTRKKILSPEDLRLAQARRLSRDAAEAFKKYEKEAEELKKKIKPRPNVQRKVLNQILGFLELARESGENPDTTLNQYARMLKITRQELDEILQKRMKK